MSQQTINIGSVPADGSGDPIRVSFDKINQNFTELYTDVAALMGGNVDSGGNFVTSVAGKTGQVQLGVADIIGGVTQGYVDNRIDYVVSNTMSDIVGGAPVTLDTLKKLADAIANNPEFYVDVFAEIATKLNKSGGIMTGSLSLASDPVIDSQAATKHYVDSSVLNITNVNKSVEVPTSAIGVDGNKAGMFAINSNYIYYCTADYDGTTDIWARTSLSNTW